MDVQLYSITTKQVAISPLFRVRIREFAFDFPG
jgi:hypothetical protein